MKRFVRAAEIGIALLILSLFTSGCVTERLWKEKAYHPKDNPRLKLSLAPQAKDVLVQYEEQCGDSEEHRPRAYWLFADSTKQTDQSKPRFVIPDAALELVSIPLLDEATAPHSPPERGYFAVSTPHQQGFELWRDGCHLGRFHLPVYFQKPRATAGRVLLTPLAVTADVIIIGTACAVVAGVVVGCLYLDSRADL
jgi:hypothetical protein